MQRNVISIFYRPFSSQSRRENELLRISSTQIHAGSCDSVTPSHQASSLISEEPYKLPEKTSLKPISGVMLFMNEPQFAFWFQILHVFWEDVNNISAKLIPF